jgi:hypothetical protein
MKKIIAAFVFLMITFSACKKENDNTTIEVIEYKTNAPLAGASIALLKLGSFDAYCLCLSPDTILSVQTDASGSCTVSTQNFNKADLGISVSKNGYWPATFVVPQTKYELDEIAEVNVHLLNFKSDPSNSFMALSCTGERATSVGYGSGNFPLPSDSTIIVDAFGGQSNSIGWKVYSASGTPLDSGFQKIDVARWGITQVEFKY